ncbi:MAG TPA: GNAT family N-acetyltransferase [Streptosporangiaceae bacterium]
MTHPAARTDVRPASAADLGGIVAIADATGQDEDWDQVYPAYIGHLLEHGTLLVAERAGQVTGFGATLRIGSAAGPISMLTDLFVHPAGHGSGTGRALLTELWGGESRKMTFSSLHAHALPLYTSFGLDAWWPLLYLRGDVRGLRMPDGWSVASADAGQVGALEREWTGTDRTAEHRMWARWPAGAGVVASLGGEPVAAGTVGGAGPEYGISHLAVRPEATGDGARDAVLAVLASLEPAGGQARACLPAPHPATRSLLGSQWRVLEFDLYMSSDLSLIDARRMLPSPALA